MKQTVSGNINVFNQMCSIEDIEKSMVINERLLNIVQKVCNIFNKKYKDKYLAHYFLDYDTFEILIYNLNKNIFYKAIVVEETTHEQLLKGIESIILGE